ncbi:hypothetical protein KBD33_01215 [Candidatus Gracilibacteria bacterium]|nr:hypothetical protein [Candidatus Gracilibacteria bacterium]
MIQLKHPFEPLHFLNALGAGGIGVSFFMYLMFLTKHPDTPVPTFESIMNAFVNGNIFLHVAIVISYIGMIVFSIYHFVLLFKKIGEYALFRKTEKYSALLNSNAEVQLMAIPLTFGMTMNVVFALSATLIPGLWGVIEYVFPFAVAGFLFIGIVAIMMLMRYYKRLFHLGNFDFEKNNNLSQLLSVFSLAMIGVGLSGPAAMTHNKITASIALIASMGFFAIATTLFVVKFIIGFKSSLRSGWARENSPSIWIIIPFLTLFGIALIRYEHAFHTVINTEVAKSSFFIITTIFISLQIFFGILGYLLMKENGYFSDYTKGNKSSVGSLALICPGVAATVFGFFFLHRGLVDNGVLEKFGIVYFIILVALLLIQFKTIGVYAQLNRKLIGRN